MLSRSFVYSVPITDPEKAQGETAIYRHPNSTHELRKYIKRLPHVSTLQELHQYNAQTFSQLDCFGTRAQLPDGSLGPYQFKSYKTCYENADKAGSAILNLDMAPVIHHKGYPACRFIMIYEKNCEQWATLDIASCLYGIAVIPIFDVLGGEALLYILSQTEVSSVFTSGPNIDMLLENGKAGKLSKVNTIVCLKGYTQAQKDAAKEINFRLLSWEELLAQGEKLQPYPHVTADTVFSLGYTSGTTGVPKGAILTHGNMVSAIAGCEEEDCLSLARIGRGDVHLSYLPIAHIFERVFVHMILCRGVTIGFFNGDVLRLSEDLQALKPTHMNSVPRLYNKFYAGILAALGKIPEVKEALKNPQVQPLEILEKLPPKVRGQFKMITGGRVRGYLTGSAPISPDVLRFLRAAFGAPIMEGFGQTETCSAIFAQDPEDTSAGNIGGPFTNLEFKLVDVPEMNYTAKDKGPDGKPMPRGELCLRGGPIFKGYYREPEKTAETIDEQGWHHTGDVCALLPNGAIKLIDRRKNIFKLAQGEYIAPEKVENIFLTNNYVAEVFVYGDSFQSEIVSIIVPDRDNLMTLGKELGLENKSFEELCQDPKVVTHVAQDVMKTGKEAKLLRFELAQQIHLEPVSFSLLGLTTPSMKLKRVPAVKHYEQVLKKLYSNATGQPKL